MPIKREKKLYRAMTVITGSLIFATVIGTVLSLYLHLFNTDKISALLSKTSYERIQIRLFKDNALTTAFIILGVVVFLTLAAVAIVLSLKSNKISQNTLPERRGALQIIRIFTGFSLLAVPALYVAFSLNGFQLGKFQGNVNLIAMLLALPASLYFLFPGITDRFSEFLQIVFGIGCIGFCAFSLITTHVAYQYEGLTSPIRACNLLSLVAMMLLVLYEIRFFASKPMPGMYLACTGLALYFCATNGVPRLIATLVGDMEVSLQTIYACVETMIALYAACRMILFLSEWKYAIQSAADSMEDLPQTVSLSTNDHPDTIEPDYTEDSDIEAPILTAEIDLDLFDRAFSGVDENAEDALETVIPSVDSHGGEDGDILDPLENDVLTELLMDVPPLEEPATDAFEAEPTQDESPSQNEVSVDNDDAFDALTDEMFGGQ